MCVSRRLAGYLLAAFWTSWVALGCCPKCSMDVWVGLLPNVVIVLKSCSWALISWRSEARWFFDGTPQCSFSHSSWTSYAISSLLHLSQCAPGSSLRFSPQKRIAVKRSGNSILQNIYMGRKSTGENNQSGGWANVWKYVGPRIDLRYMCKEAVFQITVCYVIICCWDI